jgi:hypothetical protein
MDPRYSSKIAAKLEQQDTLKRRILLLLEADKRKKSLVKKATMSEEEFNGKSRSIGDIIFSASKVIAFITIMAFCSSYLYLVSYQLWERKTFAPYFVPIDYVQLTPLWIVPILSVAIVAGLVVVFVRFVVGIVRNKFGVAAPLIKYYGTDLYVVTINGVLNISAMFTVFLLSSWFERRDATFFVFPALLGGAITLLLTERILRKRAAKDDSAGAPSKHSLLNPNVPYTVPLPEATLFGLGLYPEKL